MIGRVEFQYQFPYKMGLKELGPMAKSLSIDLNKSLIVSVFLHVCFFAAALLLSSKSLQPLPLGVELAYDASPAVSASAPKSSVTTAPVVKSAPVATPDDIVDGSQKTAPIQVAPVAAPVGSAASSGAVSGREGVANGTEVGPEARYLYELKKLLERRKNYPLMARRMGHTGTVMMRFTLNADGSVADSEVVKKSDYETLNQAAVALVQSINGLKPFPQDIQKSHWSITVPIEYSLN